VNERSLKESGLGTEPYRLRDRHPGVDAELARRVRRRLDDPALVPPSPHNEQINVAQLGVEAAADLDEKGIEVHVQKAGGHD
jgi:hypothetical protein